jgi:hypothetical protein
MLNSDRLFQGIKIKMRMPQDWRGSELKHRLKLKNHKTSPQQPDIAKPFRMIFGPSKRP